MKCKGTERGEPIKYLRKPTKITIEKRGKYCCCDNCAGHGEQMTYVIHYSKTDYELPSGNIGEYRYAKPRELWLCEDCLKELKQALDLMELEDESK